MAEEKNTVRRSEIKIEVALDDNNIPEQIQWNATDAEPGIHEAKAMLLGMWDKKQGSGLSIELWTKEMTVPEMNVFFYQTFIAMGDSFLRATQQKEASDEILYFAKKFFDGVNKQ